MPIRYKTPQKAGRGLISTQAAFRFVGFWQPTFAFRRNDVIVDHLAATLNSTPQYGLRCCWRDHTSPSTPLSGNFPYGSELSTAGVQWGFFPTNGTFRGPFLNNLTGSVGATSANLSTSGNTTAIPMTSVTQTIYIGEVLTITSGANTQTFLVTQTVAVNASPVSIPVVPVVATFAFPSGSTVSFGSWKGNTVQYSPHDIILNPDTGELIRALYSNSGNNGTWNGATVGPNGSAPRWADLGPIPLHTPIMPDVILPAVGKPDLDNMGHGLFPRRSRVIYPRVKPLVLFHATADFNGGITGTGAASATTDADPASPLGSVQLAFNSKAIVNLPSAVDLSNSILRITLKIPGSGSTRTGISIGGFIELSSGGSGAFGSGNYAQYQMVQPSDSHIAENTWDVCGCGPKDWNTIGTGATMTAINSIRIDLQSSSSTQTCSIYKIEALPNNGQTGSLGDGKAKCVLWFDDSSQTNWDPAGYEGAVQYMEAFNFPGTIAAGGDIATSTTSGLIQSQVRYLSDLHGWQFALHYYLANDGDDPLALVHPVMDQWIMRARHGLNAAPTWGNDDYAYHDVTHMSPQNRDIIKKYFRSARKYGAAETQIDTLPPVNIWAVRAKGLASNDINDYLGQMSGTLSTGGPITNINAQGRLGQNLANGAPVQLVQGANTQIFTVNGARAYSDQFITVASQTPTFAFTGAAFIQSGLCTVNSLMSTGGAITTFPGTPAYNLLAGQVIVVTSGVNTQTWTVTANTSAGTVGIPVTSQTPNFAYPSGSFVTLPGSTLRGFVDQAIDMKGLTQLVWDPSFTAGEVNGFVNLLYYLDANRSSIDTVTFAEAMRPWTVAA